MAGRAMRALKDSVRERIATMVKGGQLSEHEGRLYIDDTSWSDYHGSVYNRSNARSLARDYAPIVMEANPGGWPGYGWSGAYIDRDILNGGPILGFPDIADRVSAVLDLIDGLREYAVYDEDDLSALEMEILNEDFDSWGRSDMEREANKRAGYPDVEVELDDDKAREAFHRAAEGSGFTASSSDVRDHTGRALEIYNTL